jgi:hypothetical protein
MSLLREGLISIPYASATGLFFARTKKTDQVEDDLIADN